MPCRCCHAFCRSFSGSRARIFLRIPSAMAAHPPACWCPDCVSSLRSELDADVLTSTIQSGVSLDRRGFIRLSAEDRPGVRSPVSENAISSPRDIPVASADSSPALRESEIGYPVRTASCASCELLRAEITALRHELLLARSSEFHAIWDALRALQARVSELSPSLEPEHFSLVFTAIHESAGARLLRDPILMVRCLRYHEQRLDALVQMFSEMERQLRALALRAGPSRGSE